MSGPEHSKLPKTQPAASYDVGYGKPPATGQFQKGRSGNPKGRPRGAKNKLPGLHEERLRDIVLQEAYRTITVQDAGKTITIPMAQAIIRAMAVNAAKGHHRSQRLFSELLATTENARKRLHDDFFDKALTYKIEWDRELERRKRLGITDQPDPLPHPDQIVLDMNEGTVRMTGPLTREDKALFDRWAGQRAEVEEAVEALKANLNDETDPEERADMLKHIDIGTNLLRKMP